MYPDGATAITRSTPYVIEHPRSARDDWQAIDRPTPDGLEEVSHERLAKATVTLNNHHPFPRSAMHGHRLRQLDPSALVIRSRERFSLACDVIRPLEQHRTGQEGGRRAEAAEQRVQRKSSASTLNHQLAAERHPDPGLS